MANRTFASFQAFQAHLAGLQAASKPAVMDGMREAAIIVRDKAKSEIGNYQSAAGPFPAWAPLADITRRERVHLGYTENDPLLRSGELRDSYTVMQGGPDSWGVGSSLEKARDLEVGDPGKNLPARSVLGRAFYVSERRAFRMCVQTVWRRLAAWL